MSYVLYMQLLHIGMLSFTFILRVAAAVSLSVRPASTGFRHEYAGSCPDCLNSCLCLVHESGFND
jgi:hypothetical protein